MNRLAVCALAFLGAAHAVGAQRPAGADTISEAAVAESLKVLAAIRARLDKDKNNGPLWYHRGMLAWALYDRDKTGAGLKNLDRISLYREADSSIRIAARAAPDSARYNLTLAQFFLGTGWIFVRLQAYSAFDGAVKAARRTGDTVLLTEALVEKGRVHWRRYDPSSFGFVPADVRQQAYLLEKDSSKAIAHDVDSATSEVPLTREALRVARAQLQEQFNGGAAGGFWGEADYKRAEEYFREALSVGPRYARAYLQMAMLLADRERWSELSALARTRIAHDPNDAWAHMTAALAAYRGGNTAYAVTAFEKGFRLLPPAERGRLDNLQRMLRPSDSSTFAGWSDSTRKAYEAQYWHWSAPLWSREHTSPRVEFLARVTFAELRWTVEELRKRGADSDRGRVYIRYGPPDARATSDNTMQSFDAANVDRNGEERDALGGKIETWWYDFPRLAFHFRGMPTFGTSFFTDPATAYDRMDSIPSRWDNIARERIDSLPVRVARFRANADSVDVVFTSQPPVAEIRAAASIEGAVRTDFWLLDPNLKPWAHDSGTTTAGGSRAFVRRLPTGEYMYRFEASAESSLRGARALASMQVKDDPATDFALSGFGMSDVLLATRVAPRGSAKRWSDFDFDANAGSVARGTEVALLWENYDLGQKDGGASYQITFSIERKYQRLLDRVRARVIGSFSTMMGNEQTEDRVIYRYERTTAHAPVIADYITLVLTDLPGGSYDLKVEVLDRHTGRTTEKTSRVVIRD